MQKYYYILKQPNFSIKKYYILLSVKDTAKGINAKKVDAPRYHILCSTVVKKLELVVNFVLRADTAKNLFLVLGSTFFTSAEYIFFHRGAQNTKAYIYFANS